MKQFWRLMPFVWIHRRRLVTSICCAITVAALWSCALLLSFPVVKVLLQGQSIGAYFEHEITTGEQELAERREVVDHLQTYLTTLPEADAERVETLRELSRQQRRLSSVSWSVTTTTRLRAALLPWLPSDRFDTLACVLGALFVITLLKSVITFVQETLIGSVVELTIMGVRKALFRHATRLDYQSIRALGTPDLMSRFTYDMSLMGTGLTLLGGKVIREPLKAAACIGCAFFVSWQLTLLSLLCVPLAGIVFGRLGKRLKKASKRLMESMSRIYKVLEETLDSIKVVIAFDAARRHRRQFHYENKDYLRKATRIIRIDAMASPTTELLGMVGVFLALLPGAYLVLRQTTSIGGVRLIDTPMDIAELSVLYTLLAGVIDPVRKLSSVFTKLKRSSAAAERVFELLDRKPLVKDSPDAQRLPRLSEGIEFNSVEFRYDAVHGSKADRGPALTGATLNVRSGETIVLVGSNGSGKSTLINMLPRFHDPSRGSINIDGHDIRDVSLRDLRGQIGLVTQEILLFDSTIADNIRYGSPNATDAQVRKAAEQAHVMSFAEQLPDGLQTAVGEKGRRLSGGQRQRVALARAFVRDPSVLILDEATSAIDAQSELLIHESLRDFAQGRTVFIIAHAVPQSILDFVSRIVVMDAGRVVAVGTHDELVASCPIYQRLFRSRTGTASLRTGPAAA